MTIAPDWTVFPQIVGFVFLIFALNKIMYQPIRDILKQRRDKISGLNTAIDDAHKNVRDQENSLEEGLAKARAEGVRKKEELAEQAAEQQTEMLADINARAAKQLEEMREQIAGDINAAEKALEQDVPAFARSISEKILGRAL